MIPLFFTEGYAFSQSPLSRASRSVRGSTLNGNKRGDLTGSPNPPAMSAIGGFC